MSITTKYLLLAPAIAGALAAFAASPAHAAQCFGTPAWAGDHIVRGTPPLYPGGYSISVLRIGVDCVDDARTECRWDEDLGEEVCSTSSAVRQVPTISAGQTYATFDGSTTVFTAPITGVDGGGGWAYVDTSTGSGHPSRVWIKIGDHRSFGFFDVAIAGQRHMHWVDLRRDWMGPWDVSGDHRDDLMLSPADGWRVPTLAPARAGGGWAEPQYPYVPSLWDMVAQGGRMLVGDFNGDRRPDLALVRGSGWWTVPVFFRNADGSYTSRNLTSDLASLAADPLAQTAIGDLNGDGRDDIAIAGAATNFIAIGLSRGDGSFTVVRERTAANFPSLARVPGAKLLAGDFDGDRRADLALVGGLGWDRIYVRFSRNSLVGYQVTEASHGDFATYAQQAGAQPIAGDFNGDGRTDLALTGGTGWSTLPVATSYGDGRFSVTNEREGHDAWAVWAAQGATALTGDFNDDGRDDIALVGGGPSWTTMPIAYGTGNPGFLYATNPAAPTVAALATLPGVRPVTRVVRP